MSSQFITVRETAQLLNISEKKVMDLVGSKELRAYKIADQFLRLKKSEVLAIRNTGHVAAENITLSYTPLERIQDFFYFNDFYIISLFIILTLLYVIFYL